MTEEPPDNALLSRFCSYTRLLRVMTWCVHFLFNLRHLIEERRLSHLLTLQEKREVELIFLKQSQARFFLEEVNNLSKKQEFPRRSTLLQLRPFLDTDNLLRVGGWLRRIELTVKQKHPIIIHIKDELTILIATHVHHTNMHVGPTGLIGSLCLDYHIIGAKALVKEISRSCVTCQKNYACTTSQLMGQLLPHRACPAPPFTSTEADFVGTFILHKGFTQKPV